MVRESATLAVWMSAVRVRYAPPYMKNPNLFPIGNGFGFFIFIKDIID